MVAHLSYPESLEKNYCTPIQLTWNLWDRGYGGDPPGWPPVTPPLGIHILLWFSPIEYGRDLVSSNE